MVCVTGGALCHDARARNILRLRHGANEPQCRQARYGQDKRGSAGRHLDISRNAVCETSRGEAPVAWGGSRCCTRCGAYWPQATGPVSFGKTSEYCLYLNVWTPAKVSTEK